MSGPMDMGAPVTGGMGGERRGLRGFQGILCKGVAAIALQQLMMVLVDSRV